MNRIAILNTAVADVPTCLRSRAALATVIVDEEAGIIRNCRVMTAGNAKGHGFNLDATSVKQALDLLNADSDGMKMHFRHPKQDDDGALEDQLGTIVGRLKNCRMEGDSIIGDVHLGEYASNLPGLGNARSYLLSIAKDDPSAIGLSAVFSWKPEVLKDASGKPTTIVARIDRMYQVDFVGDPAANPNGLLSARPATVESANELISLLTQVRDELQEQRRHQRKSPTMMTPYEVMVEKIRRGQQVI